MVIDQQTITRACEEPLTNGLSQTGRRGPLPVALQTRECRELSFVPRASSRSVVASGCGARTAGRLTRRRLRPSSETATAS